MSRKHKRSQVLILAGAQALYQTVSVMLITIGTLAGGRLAPTPGAATLPIASMFLGTAVTLVPASLWMARVGRRTGFVAGAIVGGVGGGVAAMGVLHSSLAVLCAGTFLMGAYMASAQFYRFAAGEVADPSFRSKAISLVLAGGVAAALLGPFLARWGEPLLDPSYLASFLIMAMTTMMAAGLLTRLDAPVADRADSSDSHIPSRPLTEIIRQPKFLVALGGAATGYGIMIMAMTATPVAMIQHKHSLAAAAAVIQLHVLGMFLPSFFTGSLIARLGPTPVMLTGVAILTTHVIATSAGTGFSSFAIALVLLGVGWNFMYVGGTTLLTTSYSPAEKGKAQAVNDMAIFAVATACSFGAGQLLESMGWQRMNVLLVPWLVAAAAALVWLAAWGRHKALTANTCLETSELSWRSTCAEKRTLAAGGTTNHSRVKQ